MYEKRKMKSRLILALFFVSVAVVLALCIYVGAVMNGFSEFAYEETEKRLLSLSRYAAEIVTARELDALRTPEDMETPQFDRLRRRLIEFAEVHDILFVYYMRDTEQGMAQYIVDNDLTEGTVNLSTEPFEWEDKALFAMNSGAAAAEMTVYLEGYDNLVSAFSPVFDEEGRVAAVAGIDINDEHLLRMRNLTSALTPLLAAGVLAVLVCGLLNIFLHKRSDAERLNALEEAVRAGRAKNEFLSNMSHEIRTPMHAIMGMTAIARTTEDPDRKNQCLVKIKTASSHLLKLMEDLLDLSNIENDKLELAQDSFRVADMMQIAVDINSMNFEAKAQQFRLEIDGNIPAAVKGDIHRLIQVITNLLSNASKFTPEYGRIMLSVDMEEQGAGECVLRFCVRDTGIGVSADQQEKIFESFEQADRGAARRYGGAGLGLSISKRIVGLMGGRIWVESEFGKGASFYFTVRLEAADESAEGDAAFAGEASGETGAGNYEEFRVLLVEDVEINREIVLSLLEDTGLTIDCAENGVQAVQMFADNPQWYDLIFMDVQMPEMDGLEATRRIRAMDTPKAGTVPIVAMSANVFEEDVAQCLTAGMNDHIGKPLSLDEILVCLYKYLGGAAKDAERRTGTRRKGERRQTSDRRQLPDRRKLPGRRKEDFI